MVFWFFRRRPPLWARIARATFLIGSAAGAAIGAEMVRRKFGLGSPRIDLERNGRTTRVRVSVPPRRRKRRASASRS